jgi:HK97 family phage major capsid protein
MTIKELSEKRQTLWAQAKALNDKATTEKRSMTAEEAKQFDEITNEVDGLRSQIDELEAAERRSKFLADEERELARSRGRRSQPDKPENPEPLAPANKTKNRFASDEYRSAFSGYMRQGLSRLAMTGPDEFRALSADSDVSGGYLQMPEQMVTSLVKFVDDLVFIRGLATVYQLSMAESLGAASLEADPADANWTAEIQTGSEDSTMAFGKRKLTPHPLAKRIKVSRTLLERASMGAEALVTQRLGYKFAITEEKGFLTGSGSNQPLGVFTASNDGIPTSRDVSTDNTGTAITADGLINAKFNLKAQYMNSPSTRWVFHRDAVRNIRKLKDGNGQYLWQAGLGGTPDTILEVPYAMSEYAPNTFTSGLYVGIIGDFKQYWIAEAKSMGLQRLDELYAENNQVGFIGRQEVDGMPVLAEAFSRVTLG